MSYIRNETAYNDISGGLLMRLDDQIPFCIRGNKIAKAIYQLKFEFGQPWKPNILPFPRYGTTYDHLIYLFVQMILNKLHIEMVFLENVST